MRRILSILLTMLFICIVLAGCSAGNTASAKDTELSSKFIRSANIDIWYNDEHNNRFYIAM